MKNFLKKTGIILVCCANIFAQAETPCNENIIQLPENYYILSEYIIFADNKIYVNIHDEKYETTALFSDENGYFIQTIRGKCLGLCKWYEWECGRCGFCNLYELECGNCKGLKAHVKCEK
jgi:hypothetical protein